MALSMSVSAGAHNERHNTDLGYRATLSNVDPALSKLNVVLADEGIRNAYARRFGAAAEAYNQKQVEKNHPERVIEDYYEKIRDAWRADQAKVKSGNKGRGNVAQPCYEYVVQIGNRDTWRAVSKDTLTQVYAEAFERVKERTAGAIDWFQAAIHYDEPDGSGHMHMAGIPYGTGNKRGLETQVSMGQALKRLGLERLPDLQNLMMRELEAVAHEHGIEREVMGCDRRHQDVAEFKQTTRDVADMVERLETKTAQVAELDERLERLRRREGEQAAEIAELDREIEQAEIQVSQGSLSEGLRGASEALRGAPEGARTLLKNRGAGKREEGLRSEIERLRSQISTSEGEFEWLRSRNEGLRSRKAELERELLALRGRCRELEQRFEALEERVKQAIQRLRKVPETLSQWALDIADELGIRTRDPRSPDLMAEQARAVASRVASEHTPDRGVSRSGWSR